MKCSIQNIVLDNYVEGDRESELAKHTEDLSKYLIMITRLIAF